MLNQADASFLRQQRATEISRQDLLPAAQQAYDLAKSRNNLSDLPIALVSGSGNPQTMLQPLPSGKNIFVIGEPNHRWSEKYLQDNLDKFLVTEYADLPKQYKPLTDPEILNAIEGFAKKAGLKEKPSLWISHDRDDTLSARAALIKKDQRYTYAVVVGADLLGSGAALSPLSSLGIGSKEHAIAVIAHEFGHIAVNTKLLSNGTANYVREAVRTHNDPNYAKQVELAADAYAVGLCQGKNNLAFLKDSKAKIPPHILSMLESSDPTHPSLATRIDALTSILNKPGTETNCTTNQLPNMSGKKGSPPVQR